MIKIDKNRIVGIAAINTVFFSIKPPVKKITDKNNNPIQVIIIKNSTEFVSREFVGVVVTFGGVVVTFGGVVVTFGGVVVTFGGVVVIFGGVVVIFGGVVVIFGGVVVIYILYYII